jgi:hypothetical protein
MDSTQISLALLLAVLLTSWGCRYFYLKRLRGQHGMRSASLGKPDTITVDKSDASGTFPLNRQRWVSIGRQLNDRALVRLAQAWQILEWIFVAGLVAVGVSWML